MGIRSGVRAVLATVIIFAAAVCAVAGCAAAPAPARARTAAWVSVPGMSGTGLTLTQAGGRLYASWDAAQPGTTVPREVLALLDPGAGAVVAQNTFSAGALSAPLFAGGALWVTDSGPFGEFLLRLDPVTLMVTGELRSGAGGHDGASAAYAGGSVWLAGGDELLRVSPVTAEPAAVIPLGGARASSVAASPDGSELVVSVQGESGSSVQWRDPRTGALRTARPAAGAVVIDGVAASGVWVTATGGVPTRAERYTAGTMTPDASVPLGKGDVRVAGGRLWVTGGPRGDYCADASSGRRLATLPGAGPRRARLVAVAGRVLYYAEPAAGTGARIAAVPAPAACGVALSLEAAMHEKSRGSVRVEQGAKRVRTYLAGHLVADTRRPFLVWEIPYYPSYYLPLADVTAELKPTGATEHSPSRGDAQVFDVLVPGATAGNAARRYPDSPLESLRDLVRFDWAAMDEWLEEDEPVYTHPRDPYTRVDILASSRHVRVEVDGVTLAESAAPRILFETGLPPRYYLPLPDVRMELLRPSDTRTHCPYKGTAGYWSVDTGDSVHPDIVWIYRTPLPESQKIAGLACFYNEKVDLYVDGELQERPRSPFR